ncbi:hypothetical protein ZOSMA_297G00090 [Zostera marina]|uniref:Endonuclease/exonuclease/phosphatase domain-containing protein n=1 Tax=Zostera marina TaxID=29655 RepID=A0A0K9PE62_ZOSMR|nr:hypothetical protein ZOSMA_297G00090 [Zostera marina]
MVDRREVWDGIDRLSATYSDFPWFVLGDFNEIRKISERISVSRPQWARIEEFNNCVLSSKLMEGEHMGPEFTFCNDRIGRGRVVSRLDRVLCSHRVLELWPQMATKNLGFGTSDHRALHVVLSATQSKGRAPFRFTNSWVDRPDFRDIVEEETWVTLIMVILCTDL